MNGNVKYYITIIQIGMAQYTIDNTMDKDYVTFNTLTNPPTFSQYNWNRIPPLINNKFVSDMQKEYDIGVKRLNTRDQTIRSNWIDYPVFNTNMTPLATNYMKYRSK